MFALINAAIGGFWVWMAFAINGDLQMDLQTRTIIYVCFALMSFMQAAANYDHTRMGGGRGF